MAKSVDVPSVKWRGLDWTGDIDASLIGDITGDDVKEVVSFTAQNVIIQDGKTGESLAVWKFADNFPDYAIYTYLNQGFRNGILTDINSDGKAEVIFQIAYEGGSVIVALDGKANKLWSRETGTNLAVGMKAFQWSETGKLVIHTGSQLLDAQTGAVLKEGLEPAVIADINGDNVPEIVTASTVYNQKFDPLFTRSNDIGTVCGPPVVANLEKTGTPVIILTSTGGLSVFNADYSLRWSDVTCQFQPPYEYYDLVYRQNIITADVDGDGNSEILTRTFNGTYDDSGPLPYVTSCYNAYGTKIWSTSGSFEPFNGLPNPVLADINQDGSPELVSVDGGYILDIVSANDGKQLLHKAIFDYYASAPPLIAGDTDGDQGDEVIAGNICIDRIDKLAELQTVYTPFDEADNFFTSLGTSYSLMMPDGTLWAVGNQSLIYFNPASGASGYVKVANTVGEKPVLKQESTNEISLWSPVRKLQFGTVNTATRTYNATNVAAPTYRYMNPLQVNGMKYYYLQQNDLGDTGLFEEDLTSGQIRVVKDVIYCDKILGFPDSGTILVSQDAGKLSRVDIATGVIYDVADFQAFDDSCWLGAKMALSNRGWTKSTYYGYNTDNALALYDPAGSVITLLTNAEIHDLILQKTGLNLTVNGVTMQKEDDDHLYLLAKVKIRNDFDPAVPFELRLMPAESQLPYLLEYEVSTRTLSYRGMIKEYGRIAGLSYQNGHIYYLSDGLLGPVMDYNITSKTVTSFAVPDNLRNQYPDSQVIQIAACGKSQVSVLVWQFQQSGGHLNNNIHSNHLYTLDLTSSQWRETDLSGVSGAICGITYAADPNLLYLYTGPGQNESTPIRIYELNLSTGTAIQLYSCDAYSYQPLYHSMVFDGTNRLYFYLPQVQELKPLNYIDLVTKEVHPLNFQTSADALALLGVKDNHVYLALHIMDEWNRVNFYDYQVDTAKLTPISSFYQADNRALPLTLGTTHFGYMNLNFAAAGFDPDSETFYFTDTQNILSLPLNPVVTPPVVEVKPVHPILDRVYRNRDGSFTAVFGYYSENNTAVTISIGDKNHFAGPRESLGQPSVFESGRHREVFKVVFRNYLVWILDGYTIIATPWSNDNHDHDHRK